jgi:hypothetical protein
MESSFILLFYADYIKSNTRMQRKNTSSASTETLLGDKKMLIFRILILDSFLTPQGASTSVPGVVSSERKKWSK